MSELVDMTTQPDLDSGFEFTPRSTSPNHPASSASFQENFTQNRENFAQNHENIAENHDKYPSPEKDGELNNNRVPKVIFSREESTNDDDQDRSVFHHDDVVTDDADDEERKDGVSLNASFDSTIENLIASKPAIDENNWVSILKAMDNHYKSQLTLQTESHLHKMHDLKLQLEEQLTMRQCEIQQKLASHHNLLTGEPSAYESEDKPVDPPLYSTESYEAPYNRAETDVQHVQREDRPYTADRYCLDTPTMKALNLKPPRPPRDSGFRDDSGRLKPKTRSVFSGHDLRRSLLAGSDPDDSPPSILSDCTDYHRDCVEENKMEAEDTADKADLEEDLEEDTDKENVVVVEGSLLHGTVPSPPDHDSGSFRARLHDKYSRHLADMKTYYENEIRALREEVIRSRDQHLTSLRSKREYESTARDVDQVALRSRCELLEEQNQNLTARIDQLECALSDSQRECNKKQRQISRLDCEMDNAERRVTMYMEDAQKLMEEHEKLRKEHRTTQTTLTSVENQLYDTRNELTDYKGRISRLDLERLRLERENEQLRSKIQYQNDWISESRPYHRRNQSEAVAKSLTHTDALSRSFSQIESKAKNQFLRSLTLNAKLNEEPPRSYRRQSMPARPLPAPQKETNQLTVPPVNQTRVTPTNLAPPTDEGVANAPVARQRARQSFGKSPRKSLSEEFMHQQSMSVEKDDNTEDDESEVAGRPRPKLMKTPPVAYDETNLDDSPVGGAGDAASAKAVSTVDITELERQLDALTLEKRTVETALSHIPIRGSRQDRIEKDHLDQKLDDIHSQLGAVRMQLKKCHVIKTSR